MFYALTGQPNCNDIDDDRWGRLSTSLSLGHPSASISAFTADRHLQINNADVHTRNEAIELFRRSGSQITLLLARAVDDATLLVSWPSFITTLLSYDPFDSARYYKNVAVIIIIIKLQDIVHF